MKKKSWLWNTKDWAVYATPPEGPDNVATIPFYIFDGVRFVREKRIKHLYCLVCFLCAALIAALAIR